MTAIGAPQLGRFTTMPTGRGLVPCLDVEALREPGDDQRELHLGQRKAEAVACAPADGNRGEICRR